MPLSMMLPTPALNPARRLRRPAWRRLFVVSCVSAMLATGLQAADRPYLVVSGAAAEEDDDAVWSIETVAQFGRQQRSQSLSAEYAFNPVQSVQLEMARQRDRLAGATGWSAELEYKHLFNHIARDGWGWGVALSLGADKSAGQGWRAGSWAAVLPLSLQLADKAALLHLNLGLVRELGERRHGLAAVGFEVEAFRRTTVFAEVARSSENRLLHLGLRHWIRRDRLALDLSAQRRWATDQPRYSSWVLGLGWYDL